MWCTLIVLVILKMTAFQHLKGLKRKLSVSVQREQIPLPDCGVCVDGVDGETTKYTPISESLGNSDLSPAHPSSFGSWGMGQRTQ